MMNLLRSAWIRIVLSLLIAGLMVKLNRAQVYNTGPAYDYFAGLFAALVLYGLLTWLTGRAGKRQHKKNAGQHEPPGNDRKM